MGKAIPPGYVELTGENGWPLILPPEHIVAMGRDPATNRRWIYVLGEQLYIRETISEASRLLGWHVERQLTRSYDHAHVQSQPDGVRPRGLSRGY